MTRPISLLGFVSALLMFGQVALAKECELDNDALRAMPKVMVSISPESGEPHEVEAKMANNNVTRAAGFQYVCASVIADEPILFVFQRLRKPGFHMHNVVAPIDIAFIQEGGKIDSMHAMKPYSLISLDKPLYHSQGLVIAALETRPNYFSDHGLDADSVITWRAIPEPALQD